MLFYDVRNLLFGDPVRGTISDVGERDKRVTRETLDILGREAPFILRQLCSVARARLQPPL
jgi:hypothetical protein